MITDRFNKTKWKYLSNELKILVLIKVVKNISSSNICRELDLDSNIVHKLINKLLDIGSLSATWEKIDNKWVKVFYIPENARSLVYSLIEDLTVC